MTSFIACLLYNRETLSFLPDRTDASLPSLAVQYTLSKAANLDQILTILRPIQTVCGKMWTIGLIRLRTRVGHWEPLFLGEAERYASGAAKSHSEVRAEALGGRLLGIGRCLTALSPPQNGACDFHRTPLKHLKGRVKDPSAVIQSAGCTILHVGRFPDGEGSTSGTRPPTFATPSVPIPPWFS